MTSIKIYETLQEKFVSYILGLFTKYKQLKSWYLINILIRQKYIYNLTFFREFHKVGRVISFNVYIQSKLLYLKILQYNLSTFVKKTINVNIQKRNSNIAIQNRN